MSYRTRSIIGRHPLHRWQADFTLSRRGVVNPDWRDIDERVVGR